MPRGLRIGYPVPGDYALVAEQGDYILTGRDAILDHEEAGETTFDEDFVARRSAPGVVFYQGFDTSAAITAKYQPGPNGNRVTHDTTTKVLSGGSMRFNLLAGEGGANLAGGWFTNWGTTFGEGDTFYVQYRVRLSETMLSNNTTYWRKTGGSSRPDHKICIIYENGGLTCADLEITVIGPGHFHSNVYTHCGNHSARSETTTPNHRDGTPYAWQMGWDLNSGPNWVDEPNAYEHREYPTGPDSFPVGEWFTIYMKVVIGDWGVPNSSIEMWIQREGENFWRKKVSVNEYTLDNDGTGSGFGANVFTPYMTQLATTAPVDAFMWISEFIVSSQPIAIPKAVL